MLCSSSGFLLPAKLLYADWVRHLMVPGFLQGTRMASEECLCTLQGHIYGALDLQAADSGVCRLTSSGDDPWSSLDQHPVHAEGQHTTIRSQCPESPNEATSSYSCRQ